MATDTTKITGAADDLSDKLTKGGSAAKTLGAEIANAIKSLDGRVAALEADGGTVEPPEPPTSQVGKIENFTGASEGYFTIGGKNGHNQNPNKAYSLTKLDDYTLRFEIRRGEIHSGTGNPRTEYQFVEQYSDGQKITVEEKFTVEPGPVSTASFLNLHQLHATTTVGSTPSPYMFGVDKSRDRLQVCLQSPQGGNNYIWTDPNSMQRGHEYTIKTVMVMGTNNNGRAEVWLDGNKIVNFTGNVGANNSKYYMKFGAYRDDAPETFAVKHKNIHVAVG